MYQIKGYTEAQTLQEAIAALAGNENSQIMAGGTDVLIKTRERKGGFTDRELVGIMRIPELQGIVEDGEGILIGATSSFTEVEESPVIRKHIPSLATAVGSVGGPQIRNMGTIGGNVANGATSADSASTLFAMDAILVIQGPEGKREVPIGEFYMGPGKVDLKKGEILTHIRIPKGCYEGYKGHYIKFSQRKAMDIATLGCSVMVREAGGVIEDLKIAFGVAGPTPVRAFEAEAYGKGKPVTEETLAVIGEKCLENASARDSWRASKAFREQLIRELPKRAVKIALGGNDHA